MNKLIFIFFTFFCAHIICAQEKKDFYDIARKGTVAEMKVHLKQNPKSVLEVNKDGFSALTLATYRGNNAVAQFLIENGADINGNSKMGTPLMAAIVQGNNDIAKLLIAKKADLNLVDDNGTTPLMYATQFKNIEILKLLLENKADKTKVDKNGKTAFEYAAFSNDDILINLLK
jgi:uncharacterized protein